MVEHMTKRIPIRDLPTENLENLLIDRLVSPTRLSQAIREYAQRTDRDPELFSIFGEDIQRALSENVGLPK